MNENVELTEDQFEFEIGDSILDRGKDSGRLVLTATSKQTRTYRKSVRKVYCRVTSGEVKVTVRHVLHGGEMATRHYKPGEKGGPNGGNGVAEWGNCTVEYLAVQDSDFYYHVEWH